MIRRRVVSVGIRLLGFTVLWWVLAEGDASMMRYAIVAVPLAVAVSLVLLPPVVVPQGWIRRIPATVTMVAWFLWQSMRSGIDVSRRAFARPVDTDPIMIEYRISLRGRLSRVVFADLNALMPGTLSADLDGDVLHVHVIDRAMDARSQLAALERKLAAVVEDEHAP
ncbi:Na+/H+ antiporter subunit E [Rhodococcus triatomae]|uniref:Multicomponent Na+:H+ antiporter subunit E n=1 Tax=Rhodococcus triatomae TaxID=300028 RepID=A0A1G8ACS6_9NOCA|nr:Na+/H+ antiporter subunit E [Rhodococcus triatomae]QNG17801.1 Na+/H+ antiporter subunit E [Rhodococcus triatomae]QNG22531.1 Na+/H+ antiporter subunit E [Rhodococcus triatomae]SDH18748.1 multicomponent Na+:H+ antiporter subunit E [Rhodococcus triatomae]